MYVEIIVILNEFSLLTEVLHPCTYHLANACNEI